jgi:hypothetical protein
LCGGGGDGSYVCGGGGGSGCECGCGVRRRDIQRTTASQHCENEHQNRHRYVASKIGSNSVVVVVATHTTISYNVYVYV